MKKIIQSENFNSNSDLYIDNNQVFKIYNINNNTTNYNINVLKLIKKYYEDLSKIKELVLPNKILIKNNNVIGFTMDYINGYTIDDIINNKLLIKNELKDIFIKILNVINKFKFLPFDFYLGDLHEKNVIVDSNKDIHIIDCDSYIINNYKNKCDNNISMGKYLNRYFSSYDLSNIKLNGDYISLLYMIIFYIFKDNNIYNEELIKYINHLTNDNYLNNLIYNSKNNNFMLNINDINYLFNKKFIIKEDNHNYQNDIDIELNRIRKLIK